MDKEYFGIKLVFTIRSQDENWEVKDYQRVMYIYFLFFQDFIRKGFQKSFFFDLFRIFCFVGRLFMFFVFYFYVSFVEKIFEIFIWYNFIKDIKILILFRFDVNVEVY